MSLLNSIEESIKSNNIEIAYKLIIETESIYLNDADYWNLRGVLCLKVGEVKAAKACLEKSIKLNPNNGDVYFNYANALERIGNKSDSALYYGLAYRYTDDIQLKHELIELYDSNSTLGNIFSVASLGKDKRFIILSSCGWGDLYQRMHHIARSLAKFGHEVIYITPSVSLDIELDNYSEVDLINYSIEKVRIVDGVKIYTPFSIIRGETLSYSNYLGLTQTLLDSTVSSQNVIISYMPYQVNFINALSGEFYHIYDCVDDHTDLDYAFWGNSKDILWEQQLMDKADAITTTATSLFLQRVTIEGRKNVYISKNAVNESDFLLSQREYVDIPDDLKEIPEPRIVFTGVVYRRFDEKLFYQIVESNPDKSFVIIGPIHEGMLTRKYDNLYLLGHKHHSILSNYLKHMQIGIVPYIYNADMDIACDSIKQYEYIACNLPVITTYMPESGMDKIYTFLANTKETFNEAIDKCLSLELDSNVISDYLARNSWNERAALLCRIVDKHITDKEKKDNFKKVGVSINNLADEYSSPIFLVLKGIYKGITDLEKFEKYTKEAYRLEKNKFIEKYYLFALIKLNKINSFMEVALNSSFIADELKKEIVYRIDEKNYKCIEALAYLSINDVTTFLKMLNEIPSDFNKLLYKAYLENVMSINSPNNINYLTLHSEKDELSPLYCYLIFNSNK